MSGDLHLRALDVPLLVTVDDADLRDALRRVTVDLASDTAAEASGIAVTGCGPWLVTGPEHDARATTSASAVSAVLTAVNLTAVARTPLLALHTAVVTRDGRTLVVAGPSGRGKTTLTAALLQCGWRYVSDEALALPWTGGAPRPYPRALALSAWSREALDVRGGLPGRGEHLLLPGELGSAVDPDPGPVTDVVVLQAPEPRPRLVPLHRQDALAGLLPRGFTTVQDPGRALVVLADVLRGARTWSLASGPPPATADLLDTALG